MSEIERNTIKANGITQHYRSCGEGPPMVLLHGWPQTSYSWRKMLPLLAPHYRCIAPDLRGYADSDKPVSGYDMRTVANDIHAMCETMGLKNVYLVGADWGGLVARRYALDRPGVLDRLCIVDIVPHDQIFANFSPTYARGAWHYFFNAVPDMPEQLVAHDIKLFLQAMFRPKYHNPAVMDAGAGRRDPGSTRRRIEALLSGFGPGCVALGLHVPLHTVPVRWAWICGLGHGATAVVWTWGCGGAAISRVW